MSRNDQPLVVRSYVSELKRALAEVPREIADEIENGVAEELAGLNATDAAARIEELGDLVFIAAEAKANSEAEPVPLTAPGAQGTQGAQGTLPTQGVHGTPAIDPNREQSTAAATDPRWYIVVASLLVAFGGIVIPVLGWIVGIVMVWMSKSWRVWEKWVGTLIPLAIAGLLALVGLLAPGNLTWWHLAILSVFFSPFIAGMWLLWRGLRR